MTLKLLNKAFTAKATLENNLIQNEVNSRLCGNKKTYRKSTCLLSAWFLIRTCFLPVVKYCLISACTQKTTLFDQEFSILYMARTSLPTYFWIPSYTRSAILNTVMFHWDGFGLLTLTSTSKWVLPKKSAFFPVYFQRWLPIILLWTIIELISGIIVVFIAC